VSGLRDGDDAGEPVDDGASIESVEDERLDGAGDTDGDDRGAGRRHGRVTAHRTPSGGNSLAQWTRARHPLRVTVQYVVVWLVRVAPSLRLRRWLLRRLGATVESGVAVGLEATPDVFWPDRITLREDAVIGYDATLLCHEFLQDEYRVGPVEVGERAMVGAGAVVLPGVEIGHDASVAANSLVTRDVPPSVTVAGVPAEPMSDDRNTET
jgi:acetyltransferase-like isoleucine patch superfamily enzyme